MFTTSHSLTVSRPWRQRQVFVVEMPAQQALVIDMRPDGKWQSPVVDCCRDVHDYGVRVGRVEGNVQGHHSEHTVSAGTKE